MRNKKFSFSANKGYYIALILCAVAIGISGYLYYRNTNRNTPNPPDVSALATNPTGESKTAPTKPPVTTNPPATVPKPLQTAAPLQGETVAAYAMDALLYNQTTRDWRVHDGIDIAAEAGTEVCAAADGTVYTVFEDEALGTTVVIRHADGYTTSYASLSAPAAVKAGDTVTRGQVIGAVGNTALLESAIGNHLHFSVTRDDQSINPAEFLTNQ